MQHVIHRCVLGREARGDGAGMAWIAMVWAGVLGAQVFGAVFKSACGMPHFLSQIAWFKSLSFHF